MSSILGRVLGCLILGGVLLPLGLRAEPKTDVPTLRISLADFIQSALAHSPKLESERLAALSSLSEAHSAGAAEYPRLSLVGNYFYNTTIPDLQVSPLAPPIPFGFNNNWSAYANLSFDLWDFRALHNQANSLDQMAQSSDQAYQSAIRQMRLAVRMAYFQAQVNLEQVRLLRDSLQVAQAQYSDISHQHQFGAASRLDKLSSHQEVLNYQRSLSQAQAALAGSLRDLFDLTGTEAAADLTAPFDSRAKGNLPEGVAPPTVWIVMDSTEDSQKVLRRESGVPPDDSVPQLKTYASLAESERFAADSIAVGMLPKITLSAQAGYQDPIGPINETIQQNTLSITASMPIFDWGQILDDSDSKRKQSQASLRNLDQAKSDLWLDWNKSQDALRSIEHQERLNQAAVEETRELAELTYVSYKAGGSKYLEVQTANFQALNAKVQSVTNEIQKLMQLSVLSSLAGGSPQTADGSSK